MYNKADEYIFKIFSAKEKNNLFNIFIPNQMPLKRIGGNIYTENGDFENPYFISKNDNSLGIKIGKGKYIYSQKRRKLMECPEFDDFFEDDNYMEEDKIRKKFKDIEFVEIFEKDEEKNKTTSLSYLVNGTSYLLFQYFCITEGYNNVDINLLPAFLQAKTLEKLNFDQNAGNEEERKQLRNSFAKLIVPDKQQILYSITANGSEISPMHMDYRIKLMRKIYSDILKTDKKYFLLQEDSELCFEKISKHLENKVFDER